MDDLIERNAVLERNILALQEILVERRDDIIKLKKELAAAKQELDRLTRQGDKDDRETNA